ncbi:C1 family peptidase [Mucilaginibacter ginsenosidivorax]|uniref:Peptidase C1A papain C-terminal domain-containing protein n=1 Tax=Mucilaginibacter ginsenosidivorax TaxID=862126 RepID=A0A5B8VY95_9SPHI|nr:C1 family peptidase [Mucilaginibacter ginsenosidivorax]QEC75416.1 hypothetical protein FSB76_05445 [Mucilaginibacter ginsenosidivorax]
MNKQPVLLLVFIILNLVCCIRAMAQSKTLTLNARTLHHGFTQPDMQYSDLKSQQDTLFKNSRQFGLILDDTLYDSAPRLAVGSKSPVTAPQFSLKNYTPYPGNQGQCNSCVCWAASYGALTTSWAYKNNITDRAKITSDAKSPMFVYVQIANSCERGSRLNDALTILKKQGACSINDFNPQTYYTSDNHLGDIEPLKPIALPYRIKDFATVFPLNSDSAKKVDETRNSIANHQPVVAGFQLYSSFYDVNSTNFLWSPNPAAEQKLASHAMCIVGYNDYLKTFEVMNSWGIGWGNGGYFNISYKDFARLANYGYQVTLDDRPTPDAAVKVGGDFAIERFQSWDDKKDKPVFDAVSPKLENNEYTLHAEFSKGDYLRLFAKNVSSNCYIYVFSIDPNGKGEVLYPFSKNEAFSAAHGLIGNVTEVPRIYDNAVLEIPGNNKVITTDVSGLDNMVILYSYNQIENISDIVTQVKESAKPFMMDKLKEVLGNRLMPIGSLQYQPGKMSVTGTSKSGDIIPIILKVNVN